MGKGGGKLQDKIGVEDALENCVVGEFFLGQQVFREWVERQEDDRVRDLRRGGPQGGRTCL